MRVGSPSSEGTKASGLLSANAWTLLLITCLSAAPYVTRLGFYSDDWFEISSFHFDSLAGKFGIASVLPGFSARPLQGLYLALLFRIFGLEPLGYHLVNSAVIAACMPLLYWLLVRLDIDRRTAFAATVILIALPQLSTMRVWYVAFQIPLSLLLMLISMHCQLSFARFGRILWAVGGAIAALLSIAAYEIFGPLLVAFAIWLGAAHHLRAKATAGTGLRRPALLGLLLLVLVAGLIFLKSVGSERAPVPSVGMYAKGLIQLVRPDYEYRVDYGLNLFAAVEVHFLSTFVGWMKAAIGLASGRFGLVATGSALAAAALTFWRLQAQSNDGDRPGARRALAFGIAAFVLGHAVFLIVPAILFSPTGIGNRALVAAALGVAVILASAIAYAVRLAPLRYRNPLFAGVTSLALLLGLCRLFEIENYWAEAPRLQRDIMTLAKADLRALPEHPTVILDGVCPYHGPAILFETWWDVSGALSLTLGRQVRGDAASSRMSLAPAGIATSIYGEPAFYPYSPRLFAYNPNLRLVVPLPDAAAARAYFGRSDRWPKPCPTGYVGHGVLV